MPSPRDSGTNSIVVFDRRRTLSRADWWGLAELGGDVAISRGDVISAYRLFLGREPESDAVVSGWLSSVASLEQLRHGFLASEEYRQRNSRAWPSLSGFEGAIEAQIDSDLSPAVNEALFAHVKKTWTRLGEVDPYWAVLSADEYHGLRDPALIDRFYASGEHDVELVRRTLLRNSIALPKSATVLEYGCGLGRVTVHLARQFHHVIGVDISAPMQRAAAAWMEQHAVSNVAFLVLDSLASIDSLPCYDLFFSLLVLQHSPPPIISRIVHSAIDHLNSGGVALFQVPTYLPNYRFIASEELSRGAHLAKPTGECAHKQYEVHAIRQCDLFRIIRDSGASLIEIIENAMLGPDYPGAMSNTFLVQKH